MFLKNWLLTAFFAPADTLTITVPGGAGSETDGDSLKADLDIIDSDNPEVKEEGESEEEVEKKEVNDDEEELNKEDDEEEVKNEDEEEQEETDDEEKKEKKSKGKEEEDEEVKEVLSESTYKKVKAKYPNLFKDCPELKSDIFAAKAYREVFGSVEEATEAKGAVDSFESLKTIVEAGEADKFLSEVKDLSDDSYRTFVSNFLPALYGNDKDTYYSIVTPLVRSALQAVVKRGVEKGGKIGGKENNEGQNLINAAIVAHMDLFGTNDISKADEPLVKKESKDDPERKKLESEKQEFLNQKYNDLQGYVGNKAASTLMGEIKRGLGDIKQPYIANKLADDIFKEIDKQLTANTGHLSQVNALWKKEQAAGFTGKHKDEIATMVINRAKVLIPAIRQKLRKEAGVGTFFKKVEKEEENKDTKKVVKKTSQNNGEHSPRKATDWSKTSDEDFLNDKVTYK